MFEDKIEFTYAIYLSLNMAHTNLHCFEQDYIHPEANFTRYCLFISHLPHTFVFGIHCLRQFGFITNVLLLSSLFCMIWSCCCVVILQNFPFPYISIMLRPILFHIRSNYNCQQLNYRLNDYGKIIF